MKSKLRRFEVLLPARFNDGTEVPDDLLGEAVNEIIDEFAARFFATRDISPGFGLHPWGLPCWLASL